MADQIKNREQPPPSRDAEMPEPRSSFAFAQPDGNESIPDLLRRLTEQGSRLAHQQLELVQAEVSDSVNRLMEAAAAMAGAAVVGIAGLGVLLMAFAFLIGTVMPLWAATLIVALATLAGAYLLFLGGRKKLQSGSVNVERTRRTLERAPEAIAGNATEGSAHD